MASLNAVGTALGRTTGQTVTLRLLAENGYTRVFSSGGYLRVNPFEVENLRAGDPAGSAPWSLNDWEAYQHTSLNNGDDLEILAGNYLQASLQWILPAGYSRDPSNLVQRVYWKDMGTSEDTNVNPFSTPTGSADAGDGTTYTITGLTGGHFYAIGVKVEWDDSVTVRTQADSAAYDPKSGQILLIGGGAGISSGEVWSDTPDAGSPSQSPAPSGCNVGCSGAGCPDVTLSSVVMQGPSTGELQRNVDGGTFSTIDAAVAAGSTSLNGGTDLADGFTYGWRLRYNDVGGGSPGPWSTEVFLFVDCELV